MPNAGSSKPNRTQQLVSDLMQLVQEGVVRPGTKLPTESALMERFSVSRTVVREALSQLQAGGIVRTYQGKGSFVLARSEPRDFELPAVDADDLEGVLALLEFRTSVEVEAAGLAAARRTSDQLVQIATALSDFGAAESLPAAAVDADFDFHVRVAWATGNAHFPSLLESLGKGMLVIPRARLRADPAAFQRVYEEHAAIHDAIASNDQMAARASMRLHLANSARRIRG